MYKPVEYNNHNIIKKKKEETDSVGLKKLRKFKWKNKSIKSYIKKT